MMITRTLVRTSLFAVRLPLTIAEAALRRGETTEEWPPALAFAGFEAGVKQTVGSLTGDEALASEGRLEHAQLTQRRKAVELDAVAEARRVEADSEYRSQRETAAERKRQIERDTAARERAADYKRDAAEQQLEQAAGRKRASQAEADAALAKRLARSERTARANQINAEKAAVAQERRAVAAKKKVTRVDHELEDTKTARREAR